MSDATTQAALPLFRAAVHALEQIDRLPHGIPVTGDTRKIAGEACVQLCGGNQDQARSLWKLVANDCGGYMPHAAAAALIRATATSNLVPDVEAPEPQ